MKARSALLCLCLCLPGAAPALGAASAEQVFRKAAPAVVTIVVRDETGARSAGGSGVAVGRNEVVTNCHIVVEGETIAVQDSAGTHAAIWTLRDPAHDLCLLQVEGLAATAAQSADTAALAPGSPVYAIGNPLSMGLAVTEGKLAAVPPAQGGLRGLISTAAVAPGSSGGGLFDAEGRLIGITTLMYGSGQGYSYALAAEGIAELKRSGKPVLARAPFEAEPEWRDRFADLRAKKAVRESEREARRYLTLHPEADFGLVQLALVHMQSGTPDAADELIERALRANPNNLVALLARMDRIQQKEGPAAAEQAVRAQLAKRPDYAPLHIQLGDALVAQGRFGEALAPYQRALRHGPVDASYRTRLGYVQMQLNQFDDAARTLRIALKLDPSQDNAKTYLALVLAKLGKWQEAGSSMGELKGDLPALHGALELLGRN
ncbi:MAG: trypsin-like peptidase domain-containing protein, partial [Rhodocyclaceae bacterium]|nr:trypsin-like peptidase domain-containing protein [Rhodocyclaceae bacterium]